LTDKLPSKLELIVHSSQFSKYFGVQMSNKQEANWITYLDGWRGLAIIGVLFSHFVGNYGINLGRFGVELFFVLSGRLMASILFEKKEDLVPFIKRRISRVWPALFAFLLITAPILFLLGKPVPPAQLIGAVTFLSNYASILGRDSEAWAHLWSLSIEEWTYLFLGLVAIFTVRDRFTTIVVLAAFTAVCFLSGIVHTAMGFAYAETYWRTDIRMSSILVGALSYLVLNEKRTPSFVPVLLLVVGLILNFAYFPDPVKYTLGTLCLGISLATLPKAPDFLRSGLSWSPLCKVGKRSFSLYLWQQPFYAFKDDAPPYVMLICAIIAGIMSFYLIEQPARRYLNARWAAKRVDDVQFAEKAAA
jgi:peptidoglycan/LPS O-acetylase OafA/YrhL